MNQSSRKDKKEFKCINFNHLMSIYETNYYNFRSILDSKYSKNKKSIHRAITIKDIHNDKYTRIFKIYHNFKYDNNSSTLNTFSIKPHLIFYMYNDAKLLEVKSLKDNRTFRNSIQDKIRLNLNLFYWIKYHNNQ